MANLTETAHHTRKILKISIILLVGFFVIKTSFKIGKSIWLKYRPSPPPPPTVAFGKLPKLNFPEEAGSPKLSFKLETIQGGLPKLSDVSHVYFMPQKGSNFLSLDRAKEQAQKMGFKTSPQLIDQNLYRWTTWDTPNTNLEMNINSGNFHLRYEYESDKELLIAKNLPTTQQAAQEAKNFLTRQGLLTNDLAKGTAEFEYLRFDAERLVTAPSISEADFIRVNLFRDNLNGLKILPPNPKKSTISFLFSSSRIIGKRIVEIDYTHFPIELETSGTYPLKPINSAWNQLEAEEGYIANLGQNESGQITIRSVYLAFYDSAQPQNYLQPIYVFEGDRGFFAYVPAMDPKWTE